MTVSLSPVGGVAQQFFDNNGQPLSGGKIYTYASGTTTPQTTYTSAAGVTPHSNPIILDSAGRVPGGEIWLTNNIQYKFVVETSTAILIGTYDNIIGINSNFVNFEAQNEFATATAGQTVFTLTTINYQPGANTLNVFVDGVKQYVGTSYAETNSTTVTFSSGLHVGAAVEFTTAVTLSAGVTDASLVVYTPPFVDGVATTVENKLAQYVSVKDFGAIGDGVTDDTAAIQAAFDTNLSVMLPVGNYYITDMLLMNNGQKLYGEGRTVSMFVIKTDFNLSADGVIQVGTAEPGAEIYDIGFNFEQADQAVRANCTQYPPAITAPAVPRYIIDRVRIEAAWDGIRAIGNSGGAYIGFVEIGALNRAIEIDGSLDFVHGQSWHFWPFGIFGTSNLINVYYDGDTIATHIGRCDGFAVDELSSFSGQVIFTTNMANAIPAEINTLQLDNDGARLLVQGGRVSVGQSYSTKSASATDASVEVTGTGVCILNQHFISSNLSGYELHANGGTLIVNGGHFTFVNTANQLCRVSFGELSINNVYFDPAPGATYAQPHVAQAGGYLSVVGCEWANIGVGSGITVFYTSDGVGNRCTNNNFGGWTYSPPAFPNGNGQYGQNNWVGNYNYNGDFIGVTKYRYLSGTSDALGDFFTAHGIVNAQLKVLSASAWYEGPSNEAIPAVVDAIDGTTVYVSGAGNTDKVRVVIQWSNYDDATW